MKTPIEILQFIECSIVKRLRHTIAASLGTDGRDYSPAVGGASSKFGREGLTGSARSASVKAIRSRQNWTRSPIVITRGPPMVPVTEPKFAPLFGQPLEMVALVQDSVPTGRVVGIVVDLPEPL